MSNTIDKMGIGRLWRNGVEDTSTAAEVNQLDSSANIAKMSASTVMAASLETYKVSTFRIGNVIETTMYIDLTGAKSTTTDNDIIGDTGACHIGQITTAVNGLVFKGSILCAEVPAGGVTDINLSQASVATGAYDADVTGLTNYAALQTSGGAYSVGMEKVFTAWPTADYYLYLSSGAAGTAAAYTAGKIIIKMYGLVA